MYSLVYTLFLVKGFCLICTVFLVKGNMVNTSFLITNKCYGCKGRYHRVIQVKETPGIICRRVVQEWCNTAVNCWK